MTAIQRWLASLGVTVVAAAIAYLWLDRPLALFAHGLIGHREAFDRLTHIQDPLVPLAVVVFVALGLLALSGRTLSKVSATLLLCSLSLIIAEVTKNQLKAIFGRTWPDTWIANNPSFIHDGVYGFNLFHGGAGYASFPSGHTTVICAVISVLWMSYPKFHALYLLVVLAVTIGLLGANYHFLSDIIAGAFVGVSTGGMTAALWQARQVRQSRK
jgi:membrane-associated phospholipid phosphatase